MAQLRQDYQKFTERDTEVIAIGPEDAKAFTEWWHEHEMPFTGIPDPKHDIAKLYGQKIKIFRFGRMPALAVIDKEGNVRFMHYADDMSNIPANEQVLALLDEINGKVGAAAH